MKLKEGKRIGRFISIFFISFLLCIFITFVYIQNRTELEQVQMQQLLTTRANKVNQVITKLLYKAQTLSALVIQNDGEIEDFERVAATIIDDPAIKNVIMAPNGVVSHVYPLKGNEQVMGFDYFSESEGNREAIEARNSGKLTLGGPFNLVQGGQALVGRLPVYITGEDNHKYFWGLVSVTLNYPQALDGAELDQLKNQGFAYEIWRISPDTNEKQIISHSNYEYNKDALYVEQPIEMMNSVWYFRLSPIKKWYEFPETWIFVIAGGLISLLAAAIMLHNYDLRKMKLELEALTINDLLTGVLNRRGLFIEMDALLMNKGAKFILCYMDLNRFKNINDEFGHSMGDRVLQQFAFVLKQHINQQHIFGRIGGDEFILIFKDSDNLEEADRFLLDVSEELANLDMLAQTQDIKISFSIGMAVFPADADTIDGLIEHADHAMYKVKSKAP